MTSTIAAVPGLRSANHYWRAVLALAGLALSIRLFYPGLMSSDSVDQYSQALRFSFNDWHPPITALIWALLSDWIPGPLGMLLLYCTMYWGALFLFSQSIARAHPRLAIWFIFSGFAPFAIGNLGTIWKDVFHAVLTLLAMGVLSVACQGSDGGRRGLRTFAVLLLLVAALARFNAIAALPPLVWLAMGRPALRDWKVLGILFAGVPALVVFLVSSLNNGLLHAEKTGVYSSLLVYDLGAITQATGKNVFGRTFTAEQDVQMTHSCYNTVAWDNYSWGSCAFVATSIKASGLWASKELFQNWARAVADHPGAYLQHRFSHWWTFLWHPQMLLLSQMERNPWGFEFHKSAAHQLLERITEILQDGPLFKPGFWLLAAIGLTAIAMRRGRGFCRDISIALNVSSGLYLCSYIPAGVATDFRYAYWSILATWVSLPFVWSALKQAREAPRAAIRCAV
jgi:hypothetical protein